MEDVLMELVKDKVEEKVNNAEAAKEQETTISHIKNIMKNLQISIDQAMDALSIPQGQRTTYANLIKK